MARRLTYTFILLAFSMLRLSAEGIPDEAAGRFPRLTWGAEWGYNASFCTGWHYNFFSSEGYRIDERGKNLKYKSNAEVYLHVGYNLDRHWNLSLYAGYAGIGRYGKAVPLSLRMTRFFGNDTMKDRWFAFADLGSGICIKRQPQEIFAGKAGGGRRISLGRSKLDFIVSAKCTYTHTDIIYDRLIVPENMTNRNEAYVIALSLGLSLTF